MAAANARSTALPNCAASSASCAKACTTLIAFRRSPASPDASAILSCEARDSLRTRRPISTIGMITESSMTMMMADSFTLVKNIISKPPASNSRLRSAIEILVPTTV